MNVTISANFIIMFFIFLCLKKELEAVVSIIAQYTWIVICVNHNKTTSCFVFFMAEPSFDEIKKLRAYVKTLEFHVYSYTAYQYGGVTPASFRIGNTSLYFITSA